MPKYTPNLNIQLADPGTDGNQTFNIETMINDPVEKLDEALGLVPVSGDVRAATTGNIVLSGGQTIDGIALAAGNRVLVKNQTAGKENGIYTVASGAWTRTADANSTAKLAAGISVYVEEGAANGKSRWQMINTGAVTLDTTAITFEKTGGAASATDAVIGSRTISDATAPTGDSGTVTTLFGWLASMIKAITGGATWRTLPGMSIAAIKSVLDAATNLGTASTLMKRDASGRAQVAAPSAAADIARKDTVDGAITAHKAEADPHTGYVKKSGDTMTDLLWTPKIIITGASGSEGGEIQYAKPITGTELNYDVIGDVQGNKMRFYENGNRYAGAHINLKKGSGVDDNEIVTATVRDIVYYVRTDGNDSNTGLANTTSGAFKTIGKAISMIPQIVNHVITINVPPGTYAENISLSGYSGKGLINLNGASSATNTHVTNIIQVTHSTCRIRIAGFRVTDVSAWSFYVSNSSLVEITYCTIDVSAAAVGFYVLYAKVNITNCSISNRSTAIFADVGGDVYAANNTGTGNTTAHAAYYSGRISIGGTYPAADTKDQTLYGGIISGGVLNPWGDNTANNRSVMSAYHDTAQTVEAATYTKLVYKAEYYDMLSEYNPTTSRFTAKKFGIYLLRASMYFINPGAGKLITLLAYINGALVRHITQGFTDSGDYLSSGALTLPLNAGDYVEIYMFSSVRLETAPSTLASQFEVVRLA